MVENENKVIKIDLYNTPGVTVIAANDYEIEHLFGWVHIIRNEKRIASYKKEHVKSIHISG